MSLYKQLSDEYTKAADLLWKMDLVDAFMNDTDSTKVKVMYNTSMIRYRQELLSVRANITNLHNQIATLKN